MTVPNTSPLSILKDWEFINCWELCSLIGLKIKNSDPQCTLWIIKRLFSVQIESVIFFIITISLAQRNMFIISLTDGIIARSNLPIVK